MTYTAPQRSTPQVGEAIAVGRKRLTVVQVLAGGYQLEDGKGRRSRLSLEPGERFDWNGDAGAWELRA